MHQTTEYLCRLGLSWIVLYAVYCRDEKVLGREYLFAPQNFSLAGLA